MALSEKSILLVDIEKLNINKYNPRRISKQKLELLKSSISQSPAFLFSNPIKVDEDMNIIGGNMRTVAAKELGRTKIPIVIFTRKEAAQNNKARASLKLPTASYEEQCSELLIKDNTSFGDWDWDILANEWDNTQLGEWGLDVWQPEEEVDYSILDDEDLSSELGDMADGVKKAIQIEFLPDHYIEAYELLKFWREQDAYVGKMILDFLKSEKNKL
jgi:hypothetical protein